MTKSAYPWVVALAGALLGFAMTYSILWGMLWLSQHTHLIPGGIEFSINF